MTTFRAILAFTLCCATASSSSADDIKVKMPERALSTEGGRYVFGQISDYRRDQYMLDTKTGRLWQSVEITSPKNEDGTGGRSYLILQEVRYYQNSTGKEATEPPTK